jgi:hypothetical protein
MKRVRGIKALSIGAIIANGVLLALLINLWMQLLRLSKTPGTEVAIFLGIISGLVFAIAYPVQLLFMRMRYYQYAPDSSTTRVFLHITRILQLLFNIFLALGLAGALYETFRQKGEVARGSHFYQQVGLLFLMLTTFVLNLLIFFKGWRLLKLMRTSYIDHVMNAFD